MTVCIPAGAGNFSEEKNMEYHFYGWETADTKPENSAYPSIQSPVDLYNALSQIWCAQTCAPRLRSEWTKENITKGQCSITAFLAQDIFGGKVYGIPMKDGNFHCYNVAAAALVKALKLDDTELKDCKYYPYNMAHFC